MSLKKIVNITLIAFGDFLFCFFTLYPIGHAEQQIKGRIKLDRQRMRGGKLFLLSL